MNEYPAVNPVHINKAHAYSTVHADAVQVNAVHANAVRVNAAHVNTSHINAVHINVKTANAILTPIPNSQDGPTKSLG